ncbi:MalY/PatB family protein [Saccharomonospora halophila]|uniref:MalY/PatB family protein n=1 Tax=Saccharomonospora halophila TaxID=129922 RepID=UPI00036BD2C5|nr:aminotransferase class I/II-fold pyridoxal phosphate-dependent enzyme [Saccharomonospora halophila]
MAVGERESGWAGIPDLARRDGEKWHGVGEGVVSAWVADMDFAPAPAVREALSRRSATDLGYPAWFDQSDGGPLGEIYAARTSRLFGHSPVAEYVRLFTDINHALGVTLHVATQPGDAVLLQTPATPPFTDVISRLGRRPTTVPMVRAGDRWVADLDEIETRVLREGCRVLFLVNPHNPTGHVYERTELERLAEIACRHGLLVVSDEVHAELTYEPHRHIPFASLSAEVADRTVTLTSGSKAFNLAGIRCAVAHVGARAVRKALDAQHGLLFGQVGVLAVEALKAAWTGSDDWLTEIRGRLARNRQRLSQDLSPRIGFAMPDATYLAWLDCRELGVGDAPWTYFREQARVLLFDGTSFGAQGRGFVRLNFATPETVLDVMIDRINNAVEALPS